MKVTFLNAITMTVEGSYIFKPVAYDNVDFFITAMSIDFTNGINDIQCNFSLINRLNGDLHKITLVECAELLTNTDDINKQERLLMALKRDPNYIYSIDEEQLKKAIDLLCSCIFCGFNELSFKNPKEYAQRVYHGISQ